MQRRLSSNLLFVGGAAVAALLLTIIRPTPQGLGELVRAAPGQPANSIQRKHNLSALKIFNLTQVRIRDRYVDSKRIDPREMLYEALDSVQFDIPEVLINPSRSNNSVSVTVNDKNRVFSTADVDSPWRLSGKLKSIFAFIEANMNPGADLARVEYSAVNGMLSTLDPHSSLLDPDLAAEMDVNTSGKFGGLGILIGMRDRKLTVIRPFKNTPASAAGIQPGDHIAKIGDEITENLSVTEAADRMRGEPGTQVVLTIERKDQATPLVVPLTRASIRVPSVESKLLLSSQASQARQANARPLGYIKLKQFGATTTKEVAKAMKEMRAQGAVGWILDLRGNPGGLLEQAISVSDLFVNSGTIVTTVSGSERESRRASSKGTDSKTPVAVLINGNSASASEIVAGALKNLERAITIGKSSFGKGSVQILYDNEDGSKLKLTIAEYLTPKDLSIQSVGIVPDIELARMFVPAKNDGPRDYLRLKRSRLSHGERDLKASLRSKYAKKPLDPDFQLSYLFESKKKSTEKEGDAEPPDEDEEDSDEIKIDYEIALASEILRTAGASTRTRMLKNATALLAKRSDSETGKLSQKLAVVGVDWSGVGSATAQAPLQARFELVDSTSSTPSADGQRRGAVKTVRAGDTIKLKGIVTNTGKATAYRVLAKVASHSYIFNDAELAFGKIEPGTSREWITQLKVPDTALDGIAVLDFNISGDGVGTVMAPALRLRIDAADRPVFSYAHQLIDLGNGDGLVQRGERFKLRVTVKNTGSGVAKETSAVLRNASGDAVKLEKARFEIGELKPNQEQTVEFQFAATKAANDNVPLVVELMVNDWNLREGISEKLKYPVVSSGRPPLAERGVVKVVDDKTKLHEGASTKASAIAIAPKGTTFAVDGRLGDWFRVKGPKGRPAFIHGSHVSRSNARPTPDKARARWQVTPPTMALKIPKWETTSESYKLAGTIRDDSQVEDVYIFVSNREAKIANRKVFYRSNRGSKTSNRMSFETEIPLWPGSNMVTVVARENGDVKTSETLYLYRNARETSARAGLRP